MRLHEKITKMDVRRALIYLRDQHTPNADPDSEHNKGYDKALDEVAIMLRLGSLEYELCDE